MKIDLIKGECLEVMKSIPNASIDAIITDPPYGTTACKWDSVIPFEPMWEQLNRIIKTNGAIVLFGSEPFSSVLRMSNIKNYKYDWKWDKKQGGNPLNAKIQPLKTYEDLVVFNKHNYYPIKEKRGKPRKKGGLNKQPEHLGRVKLDYYSVNNEYYPRAILEISNANKRNKKHPTQKPVSLMEYLIKTYTKENETVLDFTMGSGSTGVAAVYTKRNFIGIELNDKYFEIAKKRIEQAQLKLF